MSGSPAVIDVALLREQAANWRLGLLLLLCLILGGTSQDIVSVKLPLYLTSLVVIALALTSRRRSPLSELRKMPEVFGGLLLLLYFIYLIPLPPVLWTELQGRQDIAEGFKKIGSELPWLPMSLSPEKTLFSIFDFLPLISVTLIFRLQASSTEKKNALLMIVLMGMLSVFFGIFQIIGAEGFYIYEISNKGLPVGFFSNANHQACFLSMTLPLALILALKPEYILTGWLGSLDGSKLLGICSTIVIVTGILLTSSLAGYLFLLIIFPPAMYIAFRGVWGIKYISLFVALAFLGLLFDFTVFGGHMNELSNKLFMQSDLSRNGIFPVTLRSIENTGLVGSGPGSFLENYRTLENRATMTVKYAPQAHNDYLQIILEFGILGLTFILGFMAWMFSIVYKIFRTFKRQSPLGAFLGLSLLCPIIHSAIDYPLRTISIAVVFYFLLIFLEFSLELKHRIAFYDQ